MQLILTIKSLPGCALCCISISYGTTKHFSLIVAIVLPFMRSRLDYVAMFAVLCKKYKIIRWRLKTS